MAPGAAGVLVFVKDSELPRFSTLVDKMNARAPVSKEVLKLYCVRPTREATNALSHLLRSDPSLSGLEAVDKLKPNNALRDLTAPWRLTPEFSSAFHLLVSLETVSAELRSKYPHPNLTLQAGKIESGETPLQAAVRELYEEANISVNFVTGPPVTLMSKGMFMYTVFVTETTSLYQTDEGTLFIHN
jgi:hypothetical protein